MRLKFETKARNLSHLFSRLKSAQILPSVILDASKKKEWSNRLRDIAQLGESVIIRSSSNREDLKDSSNAGAFLSMFNISTKDLESLLHALNKVAHSMGNDGEILIQPMLKNICSCGVAFSVDKENLSPYFCIEYDTSGSTSSVTSGEKVQNISSFVFRDYKIQDNQSQIARIIALLLELERIFDYPFLDIEFAFCLNEKGDEELYCLQVRPLVIKNKQNLSKQIRLEDLKRLSKRIDILSNTTYDILGSKKIFGIMPDWNPAEIIGLRPKRLALSLYKEIVTDYIWAYQRKKYGYRDLRSHQLMHSFFGIPYIDVQLSFNSFIPANLEEKIAEKLVNYYLRRLSDFPFLHDKIEFEIVFSCFDFLGEKRLDILRDNGFSSDELNKLSLALQDITRNIVSPRGLFQEDLACIQKMKERFVKLLDLDMSKLDVLYWLIEDCKRYGTLPFAGIARAAFVAMQLLNSMVEIKLLSQDQKKQFLESLNTVSKQLASDRQELNQEDFLNKYGHLRAGTYDILSPRYDEDYEKYFGNFNFEGKIKKTDGILFQEGQLEKIDQKIKEIGLEISALDLFDFMKQAIEGRESAKFEFTKMLSKAIETIGEIGQYYGISLDEIAHLDIKDILSLHSTFYRESPRERFLQQIFINKKDYLTTCAIKLPPLISSGDDVFCFSTSLVQPNFITLTTVVGDVALEDHEIEGKIVLIEAADPGYDYLFTKGILGLITCYGGANSHMAIRCSEVGLPAAIGVGEDKFMLYKKARRLQIDCLNQKIIVLM